MNVLIVFYSRTGVTRKTCETLAGALREAGHVAEVEELHEVKRSGFFRMMWRAGLRRSTPIAPVDPDVAAFDLVVIATPVWAFSATPAVRTFCAAQGRSAKQVAFIATMGGSGDKGAFKCMTRLTGKSPAATLRLIDKAVKKDDPEGFVAKVKAFAGEIAGGAEN